VFVYLVMLFDQEVDSLAWHMVGQLCKPERLDSDDLMVMVFLDRPGNCMYSCLYLQ